MKSIVNKALYSLGGTFKTIGRSIGHLYSIISQKIIHVFGTSISVNDTVEASMRITLGASELTQDGTPTPSSPEDIHTISGSNKVVVNGKNLFDEEYYNNDNLYSINVYKYTKLNIKGNRKIYGCAYLKEGKTSISGLYLCLCSEVQPNVSGAVTKWLVSNGSISSMSYGDFTGHNDIYLSWYPTSITPAQIFETYNIMVALSDTTYTPYVSQEADIDLKSKNLFNRYTITTGKELYNDGSTGVAPGWYVSDYMPVEEGKYYTSTGVSSYTKCWYDSTKTFISKTTTQTAQAPTNAKYLLVNGALSSYASTPEIQIEEGQTATEYEEHYDYGFYGKIGNYEDRIFKNVSGDVDYSSEREDGAWYIKKNIGKVVLDGTENWNEWTGFTSDYFGGTLDNYIDFNNAIGTDNRGISNYFPVLTGTNINMAMIGLRNQGDSFKRIYCTLSKNNVTDITQFKQWFATNNTILYYALSTPTYTKITGTLAEQLENVYKNMLSQAGQTNISQVPYDLPFELEVDITIEEQ